MNSPYWNRQEDQTNHAAGRTSQQLIPSPIDELQLRDHENLLGADLPPLFRAYLMSWCLPETDLYVGQLPRIRPDKPFEMVEHWSIGKMEQPFYRRQERLIPFTHGPADISDLCFDVYNPDDGGDYPIVKVAHERWFGARAERLPLDCDECRVFDSYSDYFAHLLNWLIYKSAERTAMFEDWLRENGKGKPELYYHSIM